MFPYREIFTFVMRAAFEVEFLEELIIFLGSLDQKEREKIIYNIDKSRFNNDSNLLKKITGTIWEFRTVYNNKYFRIFAFGLRDHHSKKLIIATHGIIKKSNKIPKKEIEKAERIRHRFLKERNEN